MNFNIDENTKYKAIYKGSFTGKTKELNIINPTEAIINFMQKDDDDSYFEIYSLVRIEPIKDYF